MAAADAMLKTKRAPRQEIAHSKAACPEKSATLSASSCAGLTRASRADAHG